MKSSALKIVIPLIVLGVGLFGAATLVARRPTVDSRPPDRPAPLVRVIRAEPVTLKLRVTTHGTVAPRTESDLVPEISGPAVWVSPSFVSGGFFAKGEPLLRIDPRDYDVALERARATLERSDSEHERAKKELARRSRLADRNVASEAQLDDATNAERVARAMLREARASLDQARLDRARTEIRAPFAGRVREEHVDVGQFVTRGNPVAKLYAIDFAEVRLPIADDELAFLDLPRWYRDEDESAVGPEVRLSARFAGAEHAWNGQVVRTEGEIDPKSRMVHVVARVDDPYGRAGAEPPTKSGGDPTDERPPLAVGLFVEAEIAGREVQGVVVVPRSAMRGPDRLLVVDGENRVRFRNAEIVRTGAEDVVLRSGLEPGDRVVVSALSAAVDGMLVRPADEDDQHEAHPMTRLVAWFATNHVAANLIMFLLLVGGISTMFAIPQKTFPDIDVEMVSIGVEYLGAAPEEVEEGVCIRIEEQVEGIDGIDTVHSTATEGACAVFIEMLQGADAEQVVDDVRNRVEAIDTFPEEVEKPVIAQVTVSRPVLDVAISGRADERSLKELGERVRDEILALSGVTQASLLFTRAYEVSIEVPEESLRRFGLTFDQVVEAVRRSSLDLPGGSIKTRAGEILLRTKGQAYRGQEFEKIVVHTRNDGTRVTLADIGRVVDGFEDVDLITRFDGEPSVMVQVSRVGDQDVIEISDRVKDYVAEAQPRMPDGIRLSIWQDDSQVLRGRLDTMFRNGRSGFMLVFVLLALFLRFRLAFWVTLGVPVAFMGALWTLPFFDVSINAISLFAFIVVLGILVDDAIVVAENIHTHQEREPDRLKAAIQGAQEVATPVVFGVLTTVAAFAPALTVPGPMGQVFSVMATVVIACLVFSVIESQLVLPAHLSHGMQRRAASPRSRFSAWWGTHVAARWRAFQERFSSGMSYVANNTYARFLERALEWRLLTVASGLAALMLTLGVIAGGHMHFSFFPPIEADYLAARLTMPQGTPVEVTAAATRQLVDAAEKLREKLDPEYAGSNASLIKYVLAAVGSQPFLDRQSQGPARGGVGGSSGGSHVAEVVLELVPSEDRAISTSDVGKHWRELSGSIPDAVELVFASDLFSVGEALNVQLEGADIEHLRAAADRLKLELAGYPGVIDIADSFRSGKQEIELAILPTAEPLGLTMRDLARQVRQAFYGEEAQRIQRGRDDVRVMVRYPELQRRSIGDLESTRIRTPDGTEVPFSTVARAELGRGFAAIRRTDRKRVVNVTADVDRNLTTANDVIASLRRDALPRILGDYPSVSYALEGAQREQSRALSGLARSYLIALLAIYALLAVPLRSYSQPLIIMSVIPFGLVGAIGGHLLLGKGLSFMSVVGIIALSGVVVNDSLVLVHYVNQRRASGLALAEAVRRAGISRFRPIVLTSLTTFVGLTPLMMERSVQAQFLIPMAVSLAFGSLFATVITLVIVPSSYLLLEDLARLFRRGRRAETGAEMDIGNRSAA